MDEGGLKARFGEHSDAIRLTAPLAAAAGVIHAVALAQHIEEGPLYGAFFAAVSASQLAWGAALYHRPCTRRSLALGATANLAVAAVWFDLRTSGLPLRPEAGQPETVAISGLLATSNEMAIAGLASRSYGPPDVCRLDWPA